MVWQERVLPEDKRELYLMWVACGRNYAACAREYGASEGSVRRAVKQFMAQQEAAQAKKIAGTT